MHVDAKTSERKRKVHRKKSHVSDIENNNLSGSVLPLAQFVGI